MQPFLRRVKEDIDRLVKIQFQVQQCQRVPLACRRCDYADINVAVFTRRSLGLRTEEINSLRVNQSTDLIGQLFKHTLRLLFSIL